MTNLWLRTALAIALSYCGRSQPGPPAIAPPNTVLRNGLWFNGRTFEPRTLYSVGGHFMTKKPAHVDRVLDLEGAWIVPPFGEGHNHNIGTGVQERDRKTLARYRADGVFYVKIQGNLPLSLKAKQELSLNRPDNVNTVLAQGSLTATGGHPIALVENLLRVGGYYPGYTKETLEDYRYFTVDSAADLDRKWPQVVGLHPDFIKVFLWCSDEFEIRKGNPAYFGRKGLDP